MQRIGVGGDVGLGGGCFIWIGEFVRIKAKVGFLYLSHKFHADKYKIY